MIQSLQDSLPFLRDLALVHYVLICFVFVLALLKEDNSIVDIMWGLLFVLSAVLSFAWMADGSPLQMVLTLLVCAWGLRLALHILVRHWGKPEDFRYAKWRQDWGRWFVLRSFFQVFFLQAFLHFFIVAPVVWANLHFHADVALGVFQWVGLGVWCLGFFFEAVGDAQLSRFIKHKKKGEIMTTGLWRYTRHPNYFGEVTQWWGIYLMVADQAWWLIFSPLLISFLILYVSGIPMLEAKYKGRPNWEAYAKKTSAFFPLPPRS